MPMRGLPRIDLSTRRSDRCGPEGQSSGGLGQLVCHLGRLSPCQATVSPTSAEGSGEGTGFGMASAAAI